jgi:hypothetical protein
MTNDGLRFIDFIPKELIKSINSVELKITLINNSILKVVGSNSFDSLRGTNPSLVIFSEWAYSDERAYQTISPVLLANQGTAIFISTPQGKNFMYDQYNMAINNPDWFTQLLTVNDTKHISVEDIEKERIAQRKGEDWVKQEFECSWEFGAEGAYYSKYLTKMKLNNQIGRVPYDPTQKVHTAWDLGLDDHTCIIFFQLIGSAIHIIDCILDKDKGLDHYIREVLRRDYIYGVHIGPHDITVREFGNSAITRKETALQQGIDFDVCPKNLVADGIECVRSTLPRIYIDDMNARDVVQALEGYRKEMDKTTQRYKSTPVKDWTTDVCDALRYMCEYLPNVGTGMTAKDAEDMYNQALYGRQPSTINSPYSKPPSGIYGQFPFK